MKISIQQFQLRNEFVSIERAKKALQAVEDCGLSGIELNAFMMAKLPWTIRLLTRLARMPIGKSGLLDWTKLIQSTDLNVTSIHASLQGLLNDIENIITMTHVYRTRDIVISGLRHFDYSDEQKLRELSDQLNTIGRKLAEHDIRLHYHNHNCEFVRLPNGMIAYDYIIEHTHPSFVFFELDLYWVQDAGVSVEFVMKRLGHRMKLMHINDRCYTPKKKVGSIQKFKGCELGSGVMNLERYIDIAKELSVETVILETHNNWVDNDPIQSMITSVKHLKMLINSTISEHETSWMSRNLEIDFGII